MTQQKREDWKRKYRVFEMYVENRCTEKKNEEIIYKKKINFQLIQTEKYKKILTEYLSTNMNKEPKPINIE